MRKKLLRAVVAVVFATLGFSGEDSSSSSVNGKKQFAEKKLAD
jgi:hypothetical protein